MKFYKNTLLAGSLSAALVLGACSTADASDDMEWEDGGGEGTVEVKTEESSFGYSVQDAVDLAGERFEGVVTEVELDEDDGIHYYEIEMEDGGDEYDIKINAEDLSIIEEETERDDDDESSETAGTENMDHEDSGFIGMDEAVRIAKDETGGGEVHEKDFDRDDNEYEIEIHHDGSEYDVEINATTGEVKNVDIEKQSGGQSSNDGSTSDSGFIGMDEAVQIAMDKVGGGEVTGKDFDRDDNEYEVELHHDGSEYDVEINATTGEVKHIDQENESGGEYTNNIEVDGDFISSEEAAGIAIDAAGGGTVKEWELDKEDNEYGFEIDYDGYEFEVEINATTGEVLDVEQDD